MELIVPLSLQFHLEQNVYIFLFGRKGKEPSHGLGCWYANDDFNTEYFPSNWTKCHDKLGDGCTIDFPIRLDSKLKWSLRYLIKQDDGTVMPKARRSFEEVLVINVVTKKMLGTCSWFSELNNHLFCTSNWLGS